MLSGHVVSCKVRIESLIFHTEEADRTWPCPLNFFRQVAAQWIMIKSTEMKAHGAKIASNLLPRLLGCLDPRLFRVGRGGEGGSNIWNFFSYVVKAINVTIQRGAKKFKHV